jgi:molybdopterin biosynthesis enzyme
VLNPTDAARIVVDTARVLPLEQVPLEHALGRVLAHDVASTIDLPQWDNSAMDGYAVRSEDVRGRCPVELEIIQYILAGEFPTAPIQAGQCSRIFTGAPVPSGTDTVIRQEDTTALDSQTVRMERDRDRRSGCWRRLPMPPYQCFAVPALQSSLPATKSRTWISASRFLPVPRSHRPTVTR